MHIGPNYTKFQYFTKLFPLSNEVARKGRSSQDVIRLVHLVHEQSQGITEVGDSQTIMILAHKTARNYAKAASMGDHDAILVRS